MSARDLAGEPGALRGVGQACSKSKSMPEFVGERDRVREFGVETQSCGWWEKAQGQGRERKRPSTLALGEGERAVRES